MPETQSNGSANVRRGGTTGPAQELVDDVDLKKEKEEVSGEASAAAKVEAEELAKIRAELESERKARAQAEARSKDLGARLTKEQQVRAEFERFHMATLPKINKTFEEQYAENPQAAVHQVVNQTVAPVNQNMARTNAEIWMTQIMVKNPDLAKYESRVVELSMESPEFANLTYSKAGLQTLFDKAASEDIRKERDELKSRVEANQEKTRTFTESGNTRTPGTKTKQTRLTPAQSEIAKKLRMTPEQYMAGMGQVMSIGEVDREDG